MKIRVYIDRYKKNEIVELEKPKAKDVLKKLNINPVTVILSVNDEIVTEDYEIKKDEELRVLSVVSGG